MPQDNENHAFLRSTSGASVHPSPASPFYTLAIEGPNTAVALDTNGAAIVSLHFDDFEELTSDSFREYVAAAVASVTHTDTNNSLPLRTTSDASRPNNSSKSNTTQSNIPSDNYDIVDLATEDVDVDFDVAFAAALADYEEQCNHHYQHDNDHYCSVDTIDADLALALSLQEEEEIAADVKRVHNVVGGAWAHPRNNSTSMLTHHHQSSFASVLGTAPGVLHMPRHPGAPAPAPVSHTEFPSLSSTLLGTSTFNQNSSSSTTSSLAPFKRVPMKSKIAADRNKGVRMMNPSHHVEGNAQSSRSQHSKDKQNISHTTAMINSGSSTAVDAVDNVTHNDDDGFSLEAFGYHRTSDQLAVPSAFLDSYENDALESRGQALRWVQEAAAQEENIGNKKIKGSSATTRGPTSETMKRMMEANDSSAKLKKGNGGTGDGIDDESPAEYCSSMNIRK